LDETSMFLTGMGMIGAVTCAFGLDGFSGAEAPELTAVSPLFSEARANCCGAQPATNREADNSVTARADKREQYMKVLCGMMRTPSTEIEIQSESPMGRSFDERLSTCQAANANPAFVIARRLSSWRSGAFFQIASLTATNDFIWNYPRIQHLRVC
jgi:hypothetical protein